MNGYNDTMGRPRGLLGRKKYTYDPNFQAPDTVGMLEK
jgi:hypothetical protein